MDPVETNAPLLALLAEVRTFIEPRWIELRERSGDDPTDTPSSAQCRRTSAFLLAVLETEFPETDWAVRGGTTSKWDVDDVDPEVGYPGGFQDANGRWQDHYWIEDEDCTVIDLTADQFGFAPIILGGEVETRYRGNYADWAVERHLEDVELSRDRWLEEWNAMRAQAGPKR